MEQSSGGSNPLFRTILALARISSDERLQALGSRATRWAFGHESSLPHHPSLDGFEADALVKLVGHPARDGIQLVGYRHQPAFDGGESPVDSVEACVDRLEAAVDGVEAPIDGFEAPVHPIPELRDGHTF